MYSSIHSTHSCRNIRYWSFKYFSISFWSVIVVIMIYISPNTCINGKLELLLGHMEQISVSVYFKNIYIFNQATRTVRENKLQLKWAIHLRSIFVNSNLYLVHTNIFSNIIPDNVWSFINLIRSVLLHYITRYTSIICIYSAFEKVVTLPIQ